MHDKKLGAGRVWTHGSGHGKNAWLMGEIILKAVLGKLPLNLISWAPHAGTVRASALDHKARDYPMEGKAVVKSGFYK